MSMFLLNEMLNSKEIKLTEYVSIVEGDMFLSGLQTLVVPVNCVGVMGKGLALRVKKQFPDVYDKYCSVCKDGLLQIGVPYLYKRANQLGENELWFLLFATKMHWREKADINGIKKGLQWLRDSYNKEGIKSLAIPALGCGLGGLDWRDVARLMIEYLSDLDIQVKIYLPQCDAKVDLLINQ